MKNDAFLSDDTLASIREGTFSASQDDLDLRRNVLLTEDAPDDAAYDQRKAAELGTDPIAIAVDRERYKREDEIFSLNKLTQDAPKLGKWARKPENFAIGRDSLEDMGLIEQLYSKRISSQGSKGWLEAPFTQAGDLGRGIAAAFPQTLGSVTKGAGDLYGAYVNLGYKVPGLGDALRAADAVEAEIAPEAKQFAPQNYLRTAGKGALDLAELMRPEDMGFEDRVAEGLGQILATVATAAVTKNPQITTGMFMGMGADQQAQSITNAGLNPDEMLPELVAGAGVTGLSEQMRLGSIMRMMPKEARQRVTSKVLARIMGQAGEEVVQETIEGLGQNLITMGYDEEAKLLEGLGEQATVAGSAAAIFQALVEVALPGKARGARAESAAQELVDIREVIEQTPVFQRSRESIETFLSEAGEGETVLLHGEDLVELYQSDPQVFMQRMEEVGLTEDDISRAMDGHDIEVEAAQILSVADGFEDWVKIAKADEETPTLRELERSVEESDAMGSVDFTEAFERFAEQDEALEGFERVQSAVTEQLLGAGRGQAEAEGAGVVWGAMFRQLAEAGVDEGAVFERLGLKVNEPAAQQADDTVVMNQAAETGFDGDNAGEAREWVAAVEKGLDMSQEGRMARAAEMGFDTDVVLYHGTSKDIDAFSAELSLSDGQPAIFLTNNPNVASGYSNRDVYASGGGRRAVDRGSRQNMDKALERLNSFAVRQSTKEARLSASNEAVREYNMDAYIEDGQVYPVHARLENPKIIEDMPEYSRSRMQQEIADATDAGHDGIIIRGIQDHPSAGFSADRVFRGGDYTIIFDPSNIRSVNAAFDPDHSDSSNLLAQSAPASMRQALKMDPAERTEWFNEEVTQRIDADGTIVLTAKSHPNRETDDISMRIDDGGGVTMRFEGRLERKDNKIQDPETGKMVKRPTTPEEVQQSVLAFSRSIAMLEEFISRENPESIHFTGSDSTDTRNKMYMSLLKRMRLPGYRAFEIGTNRINTMEVEGEKTVRSSLHGRSFYVIREDAVERTRARFQDGELRTNENAPPAGVEGPTYRDNFLDTADEVGRIEPGRVGQSDGRRSGDGVRGATFTEIEPAQRELFQSAQQESLPSEAGVEIPDSNGLVAIRTDDLGFITSAEKALFDPPPRFRDARNLTAAQWRKYFTEAGATKEAFDFMIEPALATLPKTGDISKADVIKAVRAQRPKVQSNTRKGRIGQDTADDLDERGLPPETDYRTYVSPGNHSNYQQELIVMPEAAAGYKSHNWNTEGVVGHIRTTDRVTADGEAVRFVDELQSDLHQEGAKYGYSVDGAKTVTHQDVRAAEERSTMLLDRFVIWKDGLPDKHPDKGKPVWSNSFEDPTGRELAREVSEAHRAANELRETGNNAQRPPRAPVKDWEKPFVRRVIQQAIEDGQEVVAFTNHKTLNDALQNEGTRKFYDDRLPAHIRKVAKELGAKVERVDVNTRHTWNEPNAMGEIETGRAGGVEPVLAIRITPEAKAKLAKGNVLFQEKRASVLIPGGGVLTDQNVIVNLLKKNDRTSFMHESAHIFLELYAALESENEVIAERMGAIRKWLKIEPGAKITRDQHEKFAESFEAYLMEGVAPSAELRSVFHSFRQWFVDVYRRLRGQLRNLEPEARDIFDRMLASDAEIEMAQGQYVGTLSNVMTGLMKPEQVEKYQKHARKAGNVARDKLFKKHMAEVKARERKAYKEERGRVEDMARAQLMTWPEYKALAAFGEGGRSLDAAEVSVETKLTTSESGEHPEIVAPEMGFTSADEMFKAVEKAAPFERVVKETVEKIMGDRYGDMLKDGTIESEAMEAVFNEPNIRMMEAERNALAEKASGEAIPLIAIRHEADRLINTMPIDKVIKPGRYAIKARDLHKKSLRAAAKGKWDDALRYTHQAMLQHELARRAFKARDEIEKANRYLAKFAAHRKLDPKKIAPKYIAKIRELMALPGAQDQTELRDGLNKFADEQAIDGHAVILPSDVVNGADLPLRRRMTMEQFREFRDGVKNLNKLGRMQSAEAQEQFNEEAQALADEIDENFKGKRIRETRNPSFGERRAANVRQMDATIIRWPFLVESLQGGKIGKIVEAFDTRLRQALTNRNARRQEMADKLAAIFKKHGVTQSELNKRVSAPAIEGGAVKFEQIMAVALNMGTEQNRDRLASDPSLLGDMASIEAMLAEHLDQRHWDATQEIWDLINTLWPEASAVERNATGVTPKKVEASSVQTNFGAYRGGYYPLKYDRGFLSNNDLQKKDEIEEWKNGVNGMATRASTRQGFLKERQQNVERPLDLSLSVILSHIDDVTNDIYMREPASHVSRLLNKNRIRKVIKETQGEEYLKTLETILKRTVTGTERPDTAFERLLQTLRINASVAILGGNVVTAGLAPISYFQTVIPQYGFKTVFSGVAEYYSNPIKNAKLIAEKSAFMRERQDTLTREAHELIRKSAGQTQYAKFQGAGYWMMAIAEKHSVSGPLWVGVYNQAKSEGVSEADAITMADRAVSTTQGSGLEIDQSVMQGGNEGLRLLSFMWGYVSGYYGTVRNDVVSEQGLKKLMPLLKHMVFLNLVASMLEALIRGGFGDEEDPYVVAVWQMMMRNTFGLIPGISSAVSKYDSGPAAFQVGTSVTRATENWAKAGTQLYEDGEAEGETVRRAMLETAKAGGFLFGVPGTVQAMKAEKTFAEDDDPTLFEAIVTGPDDDN